MTTAGYVIVGLSVLVNWMGILVVSVHFLRAQNRLLKTNDDLTSQLVALKNPYAAHLHAQMQAAQASERALEQVHPDAAEDEDILG